MKSIKDLFKRKKKEETYNTDNILPMLGKFVEELEKNKYSEVEIMRRLLDKGYPKELILKAFELNIQKEVKMAKKKEDYKDEEDFEDEDFEDSIDSDEEDSVADEPIEEEEKPKKQSKKEVVEEEQNQPTIQEILMSFEQRISNLESAQFRIASAFR